MSRQRSRYSSSGTAIKSMRGIMFKTSAAPPMFSEAGHETNVRKREKFKPCCGDSTGPWAFGVCVCVMLLLRCCCQTRARALAPAPEGLGPGPPGRKEKGFHALRLLRPSKTTPILTIHSFDNYLDIDYIPKLRA